jgi:hypothetical protein
MVAAWLQYRRLFSEAAAWRSALAAKNKYSSLK